MNEEINIDLLKKDVSDCPMGAILAYRVIAALEELEQYRSLIELRKNNTQKEQPRDE